MLDSPSYSCCEEEHSEPSQLCTEEAAAPQAPSGVLSVLVQLGAIGTPIPWGFTATPAFKGLCHMRCRAGSEHSLISTFSLCASA